MNQATTSTKPASALSGLNVLLMGPSGTGKTYEMANFADHFCKAGGEFFAVFLEAGAESFFGYWTDRGQPIPDGVHWHILQMKQVGGFGSMLENAKRVNTLSLDSLAKAVDPNKSKYDQFVQVLTVLNDYTCHRTGKKFGSVDSWGVNRALGMDGLTGLCRASMANVIGGKSVRSQSDWGIAQDQVEKLVNMLCDGCLCHYLLIAHVERETDAVLGGVKLMPSALGKALAPKLPAMFSDVILTAREGTKYTWDTASAQADVKTRNLPVAANQVPEFATILNKWKSRGGVI